MLAAANDCVRPAQAYEGHFPIPFLEMKPSGTAVVVFDNIVDVSKQQRATRRRTRQHNAKDYPLLLLRTRSSWDQVRPQDSLGVSGSAPSARLGSSCSGVALPRQPCNQQIDCTVTTSGTRKHL